MSSSIREIGENIKDSRDFRGTVGYDEPLACRTTMKVGGSASLLIEPADAASLSFAMQSVTRAGIPTFVLGGGSNVVVRDGGFCGAVVSTLSLCGLSVSPAAAVPPVTGSEAGNDTLRPVTESGTADREGQPVTECTAANGQHVLVTAGAGMPTDSLVRWCAEHGITGMERFAGLPGTVGGACYMNARCYEQSMDSIIAFADYLDGTRGYEPARYENSPADWSYKRSPFTGTRDIVTAVTFLLSFAEGAVPSAEPGAVLPSELPPAPASVSQMLGAQCESFVENRRSKGHFRFPSAGSVFKNNRSFGKPSGALIDECGLKGTVRGGAQIAPWHGNFIINTGSATAQDIQSLVTLAQESVRAKTGFCIEPEIIFCGTESHS